MSTAPVPSILSAPGIALNRIDFSQRLISEFCIRVSEPAQAQPRGGDLRESRSEPSLVTQFLTIMHANVDGFATRRAELEGRLSLLPLRPSLLLLNETKLDRDCPCPAICGYTVLSRRDRNCNGGGVAVFVLNALLHMYRKSNIG